MSIFLLAVLPFITLIGAAITWFYTYKKQDLSGYVASAAALLSFLVSLILSANLYDSTADYSIAVKFFDWFDFLPANAAGNVAWQFLFDRLTAVMCLVVTGVGSLVHIFSISYMRADANRARYFSYLNFFLFSMLILVVGGNLLVTFVGWELVGLASYLLIGFWFKDLKNSQAARKAFVMNRIGDAGLLVAICVLALGLQTLDYQVLREIFISQDFASDFVQPLLIIAAAGIFIGAAGKSAQIPLFTWLPDAMAGPTPVSALIHAATMVTAGVYLCVRMGFVFDYAPQVSAIILATAILTVLISSFAAFFQKDLKAVLAYSTVSQLGIMFIAVALGVWWLAIFHLVTHAFFKAGLFLSAGSVIDANHHEQDITKLGGLRRRMPVTASCFAICALALSAVFPLAGYFSEHGILHVLKDYLANADAQGILLLDISYALIPYLAYLTPIYMGRLFGLVFLGQARSDYSEQATERDKFMTLPVVILTVASICSGLILVSSLGVYLVPAIGASTVSFDISIAEGLKYSILPLVLFALSAYLHAHPIFYAKLLACQSHFGFKIFQEAFFFDRVYRLIFVPAFTKISSCLLSLGEGLLIRSVALTAEASTFVLSRSVAALQTGILRHYLLWIYLCFVIFIVYCFLV